MPDHSLRSTPSEQPLVRVTLILCADCLAGIGGECHTPWCAFWMVSAPDVPIADRCEAFQPIEGTL